MRKLASTVRKPRPETKTTDRRKKPAARRPAANRRSQHLLEVKARGRTEARKWMRRVTVITVRWTVVLVAIVAIIWGVNWGVQKLFWDNPEFALRHIEIEVAGSIPHDQIMQVSQLRTGVNLFSLDLGALERRVLAVPQVETVTIHRLPPDTMKIQVVERRPSAWLAGRADEGDPFTDENAYLIDANGVVLRQRASKPEHYHLPIIYGCDMEALVAGRETSQSHVLGALALLETANDLMLDTPFRIRSVDISRQYCYIVKDDRHAEITFAPERFADQFVKLRLLYAHVAETEAELGTVNLIPERNVPVTFVSSPPEGEVIELDGEASNNSEQTEATRPSQPATTPAPRRSQEGEEIRRAIPLS